MPESSEHETGVSVTPLVAPEGAPDALEHLPRSLAESWSSGLLERVLNPPPLAIVPSVLGLGTTLDRMLGGGLRPGNTAALCSGRAGGGKTAFVHQWIDKTALLNAAAEEGGDVVPIVVASEMRPEDLTIRTLARESRQPGYLIRAASRLNPDDAKALEEARRAASDFAEPAEFIYFLGAEGRSGGVGRIREAADAVRFHWEDKGFKVPTVLVVIDPIHRLCDRSHRDEVAAIGDLAYEILEITHENPELVTIFTSDTTKKTAETTAKASKTEGVESLAEQSFRGSYQLNHIPDFSLFIRTLDPENENQVGSIGAPYFTRGGSEPDSASDPHGGGEWAMVYAGIVNSKSRWGRSGQEAGFWFDRAIFHFEPIEEE